MATSEPSDRAADAAMERYAAGDDTAFAELYDHVAPRLYAYLLRRTRERERAEDLAQQTLLHMHRARGRFIPGASVLPWMYAIAHRLLIDTVRRDGRIVLAPGDQGEEPVAVCPEGQADEQVYAAQLARRVDDELSRLPESHRVAWEMVRQEGLSMAQAAEALGTTVAAVKLRAHRAYQALRAVLGDGVQEAPDVH